MRFEVCKVRKAGQLLPRHVMWSAQVTGELIVAERHDPELGRSVRVATVIDSDSGAALLGPLLDATLVSATKGQWSMTGWERAKDERLGADVAYQQSWILAPIETQPPPPRAQA